MNFEPSGQKTPWQLSLTGTFKKVEVHSSPCPVGPCLPCAFRGQYVFSLLFERIDQSTHFRAPDGGFDNNFCVCEREHMRGLVCLLFMLGVPGVGGGAEVEQRQQLQYGAAADLWFVRWMRSKDTSDDDINHQYQYNNSAHRKL